MKTTLALKAVALVTLFGSSVVNLISIAISLQDPQQLGLQALPIMILGTLLLPSLLYLSLSLKFPVLEDALQALAQEEHEGLLVDQSEQVCSVPHFEEPSLQIHNRSLSKNFKGFHGLPMGLKTLKNGIEHSGLEVREGFLFGLELWIRRSLMHDG